MQIVPYLIFNGNCREAFSCYHQHLGGTLEAMLPFGDSPECGDIPADWKDKIMHARLVVGSFALMASDNHPAYPYECIK
ncbi:VOC family protein, partial [Salmonella enterica]